MDGFLKQFLAQLAPTYDDNAVDRIHYFWTSLILTICAATVGLSQFSGSPIICWTPAQFNDHWVAYVQDYCFVENTYWIPWQTEIPKEHSTRVDEEIPYYQWVPFILALQAILFYFPHLVWNVLSTQSGLNVQNIVMMAQDTTNIELEKRNSNVKHIAKHLASSLRLQKRMGSSSAIFSFITRCGRTQGVYVSILYIVIKLLYCVNVITQFFILNMFLKSDYTFWGAGILADLMAGREWHESGHFPRSTVCDLEVRILGNLHHWSVQCVIWINFLNEKIFLFLWFYMLVVAIITICDLFQWLAIFLTPAVNRQFVERYLRVMGLILRTQAGDKGSKPLPKFMNRIRPDGVFVLRIMEGHAGDLITTEVIEQLWRDFHNLPDTEEEMGPGGLAVQTQKKRSNAYQAIPQRAATATMLNTLDEVDSSPKPPSYTAGDM